MGELRVVWNAGRHLDPLIGEGDRGGAQRPERLHELVDRHSGAGLGLTGDCERGEHDREVGFDAVAQPMEDRAGGQIGLGHPERAFDLEEVVVGGHDPFSVEHLKANVGDVALPIPKSG